MWKDWLHFSGRERSGIYVLLVVIFVLMGLNIVVPKMIEPTTPDMSKYTALFDSIQAILDEKEQRLLAQEDCFLSDSLEKFDPNKADSACLRSLGFGEKTTIQLLNYREKGGIFRVREDFAKLYAISDAEFKILKPFIQLPDTFVYQTKSSKSKKTFNKKKDAYSKKKAPNTSSRSKPLIEINAADTAELKTLYGIGPAYASRMVKYRKLLGGYATKRQVLEVYGLKQETYDLIEEYIKIDTSLIQKIQINTASVSRLKAHPYINFYQAKAIYLQRKQAPFTRFSDILAIPDLDTTGFHRLPAYIDYSTSSRDASESE